MLRRASVLTTILIVAPAMTVRGQSKLPSGVFTDVTGSSGIEQILADHYTAHPEWWLSGLHLIDLDADGNLDFATGAHRGGPPIAALNDGSGHFVLAPGYKGSEVHICGDLNEDGKVDISMNYGDGGGKWWMNQSDPGRVSLKEGVLAGGPGQARVNALIDLDRDGKVDWLHEKPGVGWELGDGKGTFRWGGSVPSGAVRNETNVHYGDLRGKGIIDLVIHWGRYDNTFEYVNRTWGIDDFEAATVDDGLCFGDIDGDGDLDIIGYGLAGDDNRRQVKLYRNDLAKKNWIRVRPVGAPGNINAAGAKIRIFRAGQTEDALWDEQVQIVSSQSAQSYYALALTGRHFGLDTLSAVDVAVEFYPSGRTVTLQRVKANATVEVREPSR